MQFIEWDDGTLTNAATLVTIEVYKENASGQYPVTLCFSNPIRKYEYEKNIYFDSEEEQNIGVHELKELFKSGEDFTEATLDDLPEVAKNLVEDMER